MDMFGQAGAFKPDSLIAGNEFPILKEGIGLKAGQGVLKRGSLIIKGSDKAGYIAGTADMQGNVFGILTDDSDTGTDASADNIPAVCYQTGEYNRAAVIVSGEDAAVENYEDDMKGVGIYLRSVQNYE
jgi:hypothetical protein